ncbi:MAG: hypothetical protein KGP35_01600 [Bacteroidetes bacterium]|nr:hypothetical protein [Bacteroidota bacterium]
MASAQPSVLYEEAKIRMLAAILPYEANKTWTIGAVNIEGNRITKNQIVFREIPLKVGMRVTAGELPDWIERCRQNLVNTLLFLEVIPTIDSIRDELIYFSFKLKERWYIMPLPYFEIIDRNANQWMVEQKASLKRVNYGINFLWDNLTGRRDLLRLNFINGYNRDYQIYYERPYIGRRLEHGFVVGASFSRQKQIAFANDRHKQIFYPDRVESDIDFVRTHLQIEGGYTYRKGAHYRHGVRLKYIRQTIADSISELINAGKDKSYRPFFPDNRNRLEFLHAEYYFQLLKLDNNAYPWKGTGLGVYLTQRGLGLSNMNLWQLYVKAGQYLPLGRKNALSFLGLGLVRLPFNQPTFNLAGLGYGDMYMRGLEYYVMDCVAGGVLKTTLRNELFQINLPTVFRKSDKYHTIPFKFFAKIYGDLGAAHLPFSNAGILNNRLLYTYGLGLDMITYYDFVAQFDYSFNQLGEKGLFLHFRQEF